MTKPLNITKLERDIFLKCIDKILDSENLGIDITKSIGRLVLKQLRDKINDLYEKPTKGAHHG